MKMCIYTNFRIIELKVLNYASRINPLNKFADTQRFESEVGHLT